MLATFIWFTLYQFECVTLSNKFNGPLGQPEWLISNYSILKLLKIHLSKIGAIKIIN